MNQFFLFQREGGSRILITSFPYIKTKFSLGKNTLSVKLLLLLLLLFRRSIQSPDRLWQKARPIRLKCKSPQT